MKVHRGRKCLSTCLLLLVVISLTCISSAQESRGAISGVIADSSNAVIPGATITIVDIHTGTTAKTVSNREGRYRIPFLATGDYRLTVEAEGFEKLVQENITLAAGAQRALDVILHPGSVSATVTVTAASPQI